MTPERWKDIERLYQAALERPPEKRSAFLREACGGDETLRSELESLLHYESRAGDFIEAPAADHHRGVTVVANAVRRLGQSTVPGRFVNHVLGVYKITALVAVGGMGEVYRALDTRLDRVVAIKILPDGRSEDPESRARFTREAKLVSSLSHPHICALYDVGTHGDVDYLVMEYVDGETLESRLRRGPLPLAQTVTALIQMVEALDTAHRRRIVHRDLKPANVMLTPTGVKLLDFGAATLTVPHQGAAAEASADQGPHGTTTQRMIIGTPQYMAPESLKGVAADVRTDIFAVGIIAYEMLTGKKAFVGETRAKLIDSIVKDDPEPLADVLPTVPPALAHAVTRCMAKDPDERWQTTNDLLFHLRSLTSLSAGTAVTPVTSGGSRALEWRKRTLWAAIVIVSTVLAGYSGWRLARARESAPSALVTRFAIQAAAGATIDSFDLAADGTALTYVRRAREDGIRLYLRRLDQARDSPIPGTEGASSPLFSPDGQWVAFFAGSRLLKVNVQTNATPILVSETIERWLNGATWLADNTIIFSRANQGLHRVSADGGEPVPVTELTETPREFDHHSPVLLPGDKVLLFTLHARDGRFNVVAETLATKARKLLIESAYDARYVSSGHLVFARDRRILAVPFDVDRLEVTGRPVTLVDAVVGRPRDGNGGYRVATNGTLALFPEPVRDGRTLTWVDRSGTETPLPIPARAFSTPSISPDGTRLAFAVAQDGRRDIFIYNFANGSLARLSSSGDNTAPIWTRDSRSVTYSSGASSSSTLNSTNGDGRQLIVQPVGGGAPERLAHGSLSLAPGAWSADNRTLVYVDGGTAPTGMGLFAVRPNGDRRPQQWADGREEEHEPSLSPDDRWLAFTSTESGRLEVHVAAVSDTTLRHQVTVDGGREAKWSADGRELVYRSFGQMFALPIDATRGVPTGKPRVLFDAGGYVDGAADPAAFDYDLAPDGRFLMVKRGQEELASSLHVVLNWVDELKRRVPRGQ